MILYIFYDLEPTNQFTEYRVHIKGEWPDADHEFFLNSCRGDVWNLVFPGESKHIECKLGQFTETEWISGNFYINVYAESNDEFKENIKVYKKNREILLEELPKAGFKTFSPPDGAFYIYVDISEFSNDSLGFCKKVLNEASVAITPGLDFDQKRGNSTIRFSYARSTDDIIEGMKRINLFMNENYL